MMAETGWYTSSPVWCSFVASIYLVTWAYIRPLVTIEFEKKDYRGIGYLETIYRHYVIIAVIFLAAPSMLLGSIIYFTVFGSRENTKI